ncbi:hypothetical protein [Conexibacter sp. CPCC 206217]|uniref:hypothetical protein n=1 Tax=Conexibacter sp. CPCC 206217 TaxID=3064574 RepID=UPI0027230DC4|nr:hypothetical protein [Conexibacter sp. CPCC 206217]MDO8212610.1 hypothetical protein [Conexibacter sp. CPCC 206217]
MRLKAFYSERVRRESSERDLGLAWRSADGMSYRAAWIEDTDEIYTVAHRTEDGRGGEVELLGTVPADDLASALDGWQEVCGTERSYEWLLARVGQAAQAAPQRPPRPRRRRAARSAVARMLLANPLRPPLGA